MAVFGYRWTGRCENDAGERDEDHRRMLARAGHAPEHWYADDSPGRDVAAALRPQFQRLLARIGRHDRLVVCGLDCLGRDARDILAQVHALAGRGAAVLVLELGAFDLAGPGGHAVLAALGALADMARGLPAAVAEARPIVATPPARRRGRPACTTPAQRSLIIQQHRAGQSISALARAAKLSRASIMRIVRAIA